MTLRFRYLLAIAFVLVATVPVLFLGAWVHRTSLENEMAAVREKHLLLASNMTAALERYARDVEAAFDTFAEAALSDQPLDNMVGLAEQFDFRHFCLIDNGGRLQRRMAVKGAPPSELPPDVLQQVLELAEGERLFSPVLADRAGRPTIFLVRRLAENRIAFAQISTDYLVRLQKAIAFGRKGHAAIVDHLGNVLAHPNTDWEREMKNIAKVSAVARMMAGETGVTTFYSPAMKKDMVSGYTTVAGVGWGVMVPQPIEELEERAAEVQLAALALILIGLFVAGAISWLISGLLMKPVDSVVNATCQIAGGRLTARVPEATAFTPPEIRELSSGFNTMAERIEDDQKVMQRALSEARLANRAKSQFLANMSHELRTPLNAIIGFSDIMLGQVMGPLGNPGYKEYVESIHESGTHLLAIINDILDLSKIEAGQLELKDDIFEPRSMIEESLVLIRPRAAESKLALAVEMEPGLPELRASKVKLKQVLVNLLANAITFTPAGGQVGVSLTGADDGGILIRVSDSGIGMTADEIELALQPFAQVDSKLARKYEGTGLGLPLSRRLVELHDGSLEVESQPDQGTTVTVHIPPGRTILPQAAE